MTNQQILEKAIQKAIDGGWKQPHGRELDRVIIDVYWKPDHKKRQPGIHQEWQSLVYSHLFAKALWGEKPEHYADEYEPTDGGQLHWHHWEYMLAEMVIADEPIKYLEEHL